MSGNFEFNYLDKIGIDEFDLLTEVYSEIIKEIKRREEK